MTVFPMSSGPAYSQDRLRVGVRLDSFVVPQWQKSVLEEIQTGDDARVELIILNAAKPRASRCVRAFAWPGCYSAHISE